MSLYSQLNSRLLRARSHVFSFYFVWFLLSLYNLTCFSLNGRPETNHEGNDVVTVVIVVGSYLPVPVNLKFRLGKPVVFSFLLRRLDANRKKTPFPEIPYVC